MHGRGAKETGPCPGRDPLAYSCQGCRGLVGGGCGERGEDEQGRLTRGARVAAAASEGGEARGRERRAGWLLGLHELMGRPAATRWRGWSVAGWAMKPSRPSRLRGPLPHFLFLFSFSSSLI